MKKVFLFILVFLMAVTVVTVNVVAIVNTNGANVNFNPTVPTYGSSIFSIGNDWPALVNALSPHLVVGVLDIDPNEYPYYFIYFGNVKGYPNQRYIHMVFSDIKMDVDVYPFLDVYEISFSQNSNAYMLSFNFYAGQYNTRIGTILGNYFTTLNSGNENVKVITNMDIGNYSLFSGLFATPEKVLNGYTRSLFPHIVWPEDQLTNRLIDISTLESIANASRPHWRDFILSFRPYVSSDSIRIDTERFPYYFVSLYQIPDLSTGIYMYFSSVPIFVTYDGIEYHIKYEGDTYMPPLGSEHYQFYIITIPSSVDHPQVYTPVSLYNYDESVDVLFWNDYFTDGDYVKRFYTNGWSNNSHEFMNFGTVEIGGGGVDPWDPDGPDFSLPDFDLNIEPPPNRDDFSNGVFGDISWALATLGYWIMYPFRFLFALLVWIVQFIFAIIQGIGQFGEYLSQVFSFMPQPIPQILLFGFMLSAFMMVVRLVRGR